MELDVCASEGSVNYYSLSSYNYNSSDDIDVQDSICYSIDDNVLDKVIN